MCDTPHQPGDGASQPNLSQGHHRRSSTDCRQIPEVAIDEWPWWPACVDARCDEATDISSHLLGGRRDPRDRSTVALSCQGSVTNCENVGVTWHGKVRIYLDAPGIVRCGSDPGCRSGRFHTCRPQIVAALILSPALVSTPTSSHTVTVVPVLTVTPMFSRACRA